MQERMGGKAFKTVSMNHYFILEGGDMLVALERNGRNKTQLTLMGLIQPRGKK